MPKLFPLATLLALCVGACGLANTQVMNFAQGRDPDVDSAALDQIDGNYKGAAVLAAAQQPACPGSSYGKLEIGDKRLYFAYRPNILFVAPIQPDGSLHAVSGPAVLDGSLVGGRLQFIVHTPFCESRYSLRAVL